MASPCLSDCGYPRMTDGWGLMPLPRFSPPQTWYSLLHAAPLRSLHTLVRTVEERRRPGGARPFRPAAEPTADACPEQGPRAEIRREVGRGRVPTIVLGGFVPDAGEQIFLVRRFLLSAGDVYTVHYPAQGFSLPLLLAQLDDLVADLVARGERPVIFAVSFGAGLALEWLRRARALGVSPSLGGLVLVSPVACAADVVAPGSAKPGSLIGRALKPFLAGDRSPGEAAVERARMLFARMFEAGAQNRTALRRLMTGEELRRLHEAVLGTIRGLSAEGATARIQALRAMQAPTDYFAAGLLPLTSAPALVLLAEREEGMLDAASPTLFAFRQAHRAYFPQGVLREIRAAPGQPPVQHASLIFHVFEFLPSLQAFYARLRAQRLPLAA